MSYTALYRKFRPGGFEDVKGQDHIVTDIEESDKGRADRTCLSVLWDKRNRKDECGQDFCEGCEL